MPAKRKIQKEDILQASISIISHEGLNALNARKIAKAVQHNHFFIFMRIWMF